MTTVNALSFTATATASVTPDMPATGGAAFGALLDQVMHATAPVQVAQPYTHDVDPAAANVGPRDFDATIVAAMVLVTGNSEAADDTFDLLVDALTGAKPTEEVTEVAESDEPTLGEIALPIEALASFLGAFIAMAMQAFSAVSEAPQAEEGADLHIQAIGVSVAVDTQHPVPTQTGVVSDEAGQTVSTELGDLARALTTGLSRLSTEVVEASDEVQQPSFGDLVEAMAELAKAESDDASVTTLTWASMSIQSDSANQSQEIAPTLAKVAEAFGRGTSVDQIARLVVNLTRELSATSSPVVDGDSIKSESITFEQAETAARVLLALVDAGRELHIGQVEGTSQVTLALEPKELGKVTIEIQRTAEGVSARVVPETHLAYEAIAADVEAVQDALAKIGVPVSKVELVAPKAVEAAPVQPVKIEAAPVQPVEIESVQPTQPTQPTAPVEAEPVVANTQRPSNEGAAIAAAPRETSEVEPVATEQVVTQTTATIRTETPDVPVEVQATRAGVLQLVRDITDGVSVLNGAGKSEFQLQLRPESLGRLQVRMTMEAGQVTIHMRADSSEAKGMIESGLPQLRQSFNDHGIRVDRFEVTVAQGQLAQEHQHPRRSRGWIDEIRSQSNRSDDGEFAAALAAVSRPFNAWA